MSGVQARNPLVDGWNRHGDEAFNGDTGRAAITTECAPTAQCRRRQPLRTVARASRTTFLQQDWRTRKAFAPHIRGTRCAGGGGSNVRVFGVQPDDGIELLVQSPVDSTETKEV